MKPFNLEKALNGAPLITRNEQYNNIKIIKMDDLGCSYPITVNIKDGYRYSLLGKYFYKHPDSNNPLDLFMQEDSDLEEKVDEIKTRDQRFSEFVIKNLNEEIERLKEEIKSLKKNTDYAIKYIDIQMLQQGKRT